MVGNGIFDDENAPCPPIAAKHFRLSRRRQPKTWRNFENVWAPPPNKRRRRRTLTHKHTTNYLRVEWWKILSSMVKTTSLKDIFQKICTLPFVILISAILVFVRGFHYCCCLYCCIILTFNIPLKKLFHLAFQRELRASFGEFILLFCGFTGNPCASFPFNKREWLTNGKNFRPISTLKEEREWWREFVNFPRCFHHFIENCA